MTVPLKLLESLDFFHGLPSTDLQKISQIMQHWKVSEGELLTRRGDAAQSFFVVMTGNFMIFFQNGEAITLHEKGEIIGVTTVLQPSGYRGTTIALTDGEVLQAKGAAFLDLIHRHTGIGAILTRRLEELAAERLTIQHPGWGPTGEALARVQTPAGLTSVFDSVLP